VLNKSVSDDWHLLLLQPGLGVRKEIVELEIVIRPQKTEPINKLDYFKSWTMWSCCCEKIHQCKYGGI